ncbi:MULTISPECIES: GntR family transcriptional regulator [unclassified Staphylococcus]|uniref:GntR family transcriptional regulator n=1 Tax=unclassified Staphylococcus TaxID=91994 RepID=UPI0021CE6F58|nr:MULTISPECIES: GntR family transcriptional regulator [unclassified Staphylococcus]UXR71738.1 GntR family transcriptional regulator [Staphylococcus sp. IVB6240]UXR74041.1 GntR family transcriptional regulator [Staphylococcus sp. IVB6238]UXR76430.1 GntR family transcriptional regulator [Staphylococcus sp. IVB6233]UXR80557.1 GntR family transcriptional regulator [Staphylococcus sp. IVB6218]
MNKYQQITYEIEQHIHEHNLPQGTKLDSLDTLTKRYNVSRSTISKALDTLEKRGAIFQQRGSGIFVRRQRREGYMSLLVTSGFSANFQEHNIHYDVLKVEKTVADEEVANNLHIDVDAPVYLVERLIYMDDEKLCKEVSYFPVQVVPYLNKEIAEQSIFHYLETAYKMTISFADVYLTVDQLNEVEADTLDLPTLSPGLYMEQVVYLATGIPFDYSKVVYHYKYAKFFLQSVSN